MSEYKSVVQAVDVIRSFLNTHESNSTTCLWESDIDGTILKTDWGYFEEGLDEIRDYCVRLDADRKDAPILTAKEWAKIKEIMPESRLILFDDDGIAFEPQTERKE